MEKRFFTRSLHIKVGETVNDAAELSNSPQ